MFWCVCGAIGAVMIGSSIMYVTGLNSIQETLGNTYCQIASRIVDQVGDQVRQKVSRFGRIATDVLTTEVLLRHGEALSALSLEERIAFLSGMAADWRSLPDEQARYETLQPQLSNRLRVLAALDASVIRRLSVYDANALLIAASHPPEERLASGRHWYDNVRASEEHFVYLDTTRPDGMSLFVMPVWGGVSIVGYVLAELHFETLFAPFLNIAFGETGRASIITRNGGTLVGENRLFTGNDAAAGSWAEQLVANWPHGGGGPEWLSLARPGDWPLWHRLACIAPIAALSDGRASTEAAGWAVVVTQASRESYRALQRSIGFFVMVGVIGVFLVAAAAALIAWHITSPLHALRQGVRRFARGERERPVDIHGNDEIGELAAEFNRMAERVSESEAELRTFAQAVIDATDAIMMSDPRGRIYYVNPAFEKITGYAASDVIGKNASVLKASRMPSKAFQSMWDAVVAGRSWRGELWNRRRNGEEYPVDLSISPVKDDNGTLVALLGIHRDITLSRQYRDQLERAVDERTAKIKATEGLTAVGRMASMVAHDMRNALSTVKMNLQILARGASRDNAVTAEQFSMAIEQVLYMEEIVRDMLSYARPEPQRVDWYDLEPMLVEAITATSHPEDAQNLVLDWHLDKGLPKIHCDRVQIQQVLRNLIDNALQAMPNGGGLSISARIVLGAADPMVEVQLADTGEGIAPDVKDRVLEPFFTTRSKGTGLGLAVVKRIIEQHGGLLRIDSDQGVGTTVRFTLPTGPNDKGHADVETVADC